MTLIYTAQLYVFWEFCPASGPITCIASKSIEDFSHTIKKYSFYIEIYTAYLNISSARLRLLGKRYKYCVRVWMLMSTGLKVVLALELR